jgi:hypothetical protein
LLPDWQVVVGGIVVVVGAGVVAEKYCSEMDLFGGLC